MTNGELIIAVSVCSGFIAGVLWSHWVDHRTKCSHRWEALDNVRDVCKKCGEIGR